jgi:hypothetical protein
MIRRYSEPTLFMLVVTIVAIVAGTYMALGLTIWGVVEKGYGVLPTFAFGLDSDNRHIFISLLLFILATLAEGALLALCVDNIPVIKREFSMLTELCVFSATWLTCNNAVLFFCVQGQQLFAATP